MIKYDPSVIQQYADTMYKKARHVIASYTLLGILIGAAIGFVVISMENSPIPMNSWIMVLPVLSAIFFGAAANSYAQMKVFHMKLAAQTALCQMTIEANTRVRTSVVPQSETIRVAA